MRNFRVFPLSKKISDGQLTKNEWLVSYSHFRKYHQSPETIGLDAKNYQSVAGKNNSELANRFRGCFLGLAVGDAFGTTLEFSSRKQDETHTKMVGGGPFNLKPGQWTDDSSMALCMAYSLLDLCRFDPADQLDLYVKWWREGLFSSTGECFDIGNTVADALARYELTKNPNAGSTDEHSAGNGSLMRLCPVVLFYASNPEDAMDYAGESSKTTHGNVQAVDACRYFAGLILGSILGKSKDEILSSMFSPIPDYWQAKPLCKEVEQIARGSFKNKTREEVKSGGYVIHSLEAALWAFYHTATFADGLIKAVNLGGDADTVGAIYGQLAGAYYGEIAIPGEFVFSLKDYHLFFNFADEMVAFYSGKEALNAYKT